MIAWSAFASIDGAVIAAGNLQVESNRKTVQHLEGGIVAEIHVREGEPVQAGDLLIRLDDAVDRANLALIDGQLDERLVRQARLSAERDDAKVITFPDNLATRTGIPRIMDIVTGQVNLFEARRSTREAEIDLLTQRIRQSGNQIDGLEAQQHSQQAQVTLLEQEIVGLRQLYEKGYAPITRILALEREAESLRGERGAHIAEIARVNNAIGEAEMEIVRLERSFKEEVIGELREVEAEIVELSERRIAVEDRLKRRGIYAPRS